MACSKNAVSLVTLVLSGPSRNFQLWAFMWCWCCHPRFSMLISLTYCQYMGDRVGVRFSVLEWMCGENVQVTCYARKQRYSFVIVKWVILTLADVTGLKYFICRLAVQLWWMSELFFVLKESCELWRAGNTGTICVAVVRELSHTDSFHSSSHYSCSQLLHRSTLFCATFFKREWSTVL